MDIIQTFQNQNQKKKKKPLDDDDFESADEYEAPPIAPPFAPPFAPPAPPAPPSKIDYSKENERWINLLNKGASIPQIKNDMGTKGFDKLKIPDTKKGIIEFLKNNSISKTTDKILKKEPINITSLMESIKMGKKLKKADLTTDKKPKPKKNEELNLLDELKKTLLNKNKNLKKTDKILKKEPIDKADTSLADAIKEGIKLKKTDKKNDENFVYNFATSRYVKKDSIKGREVLKKQKKKDEPEVKKTMEDLLNNVEKKNMDEAKAKAKEEKEEIIGEINAKFRKLWIKRANIGIIELQKKFNLIKEEIKKNNIEVIGRIYNYTNQFNNYIDNELKYLTDDKKNEENNDEKNNLTAQERIEFYKKNKAAFQTLYDTYMSVVKPDDDVIKSKEEVWDNPQETYYYVMTTKRGNIITYRRRQLLNYYPKRSGKFRFSDLSNAIQKAEFYGYVHDIARKKLEKQS